MKKNIVYKWWFKLIVIFLMFLPIITEIPYNTQETSSLIGVVLQNPYINNIGIGLVVAKIILLAVAIVPFFMKAKSEKIIFSYYAIILLITGMFQNMSNTEYGFTFVLGNMVVQSIVAVFCVYDMVKSKSKISKYDLNKKSLFIIALMALAFFMPYQIKDNIANPSLVTVFTNEAGVTYCMITPIIIGLCILFSKQIHKPTLHIISFVGFVFGLLNMMTWFGTNIQNWWMGILHLPLLILSLYGLSVSKCKKEKTTK